MQKSDRKKTSVPGHALVLQSTLNVADPVRQIPWLQDLLNSKVPPPQDREQSLTLRHSPHAINK